MKTYLVVINNKLVLKANVVNDSETVKNHYLQKDGIEDVEVYDVASLDKDKRVDIVIEHEIVSRSELDEMVSDYTQAKDDYWKIADDCERLETEICLMQNRIKSMKKELAEKKVLKLDANTYFHKKSIAIGKY